MTRTYGSIRFVEKENDEPKQQPHFLITGAEPHVCIDLKAIFRSINISQTDNFKFTATPKNCHDLLWFTDRYPFAISEQDLKRLKNGRKKHLLTVEEMQSILTDDYTPVTLQIKEPYKSRPYQLKGAELIVKTKQCILGDDIGLGKSLTATLVMLHKGTTPGLVVCKAHLPDQWKLECIEKFTNLTAHHIKTGKPYKLPPADVYIISYHIIGKWIDVLIKTIKYVMFDEVQELRRQGGVNVKTGCWEFSKKYAAAMALCQHVKYAVGLSASPVMNYGIEMFNIMHCLKPGNLGSPNDFIREWCGGNNKGVVDDTRALGSYLRERFLMIRRTSEEVGLELPALNTIVKTVEYDLEAVKNDAEIADQLALSLLTSQVFEEQGQMSRQFDLRLRQLTGIAKAKSVAALVKILLDSGKKVLLGGWHHAVYDIWKAEFIDYNPVFYGGQQSRVQKLECKKDFVEGRSNLIIISNRSGDGLDGLQFVCHYVVNGELDWSPFFHTQLSGRLNRPGQTEPVTSIYPICDYGSDPTMVNVLALKKQQGDEIVDPLKPRTERNTDERVLKQMAADYLRQRNISLPKKHNNA